jgi:hypothetical protein
MMSDVAVVGLVEAQHTKSTAATYVSSLHRLRDLVGAKSIHHALLHFDQSRDAIDKKHHKASAALFQITSAVAALKLFDSSVRGSAAALQKWRDLQEEYAAIKWEEEQNNRISAEDIENMVPLEDVARAAAALTHSKYTESRDKVILTICAHVFAKRSEWGTLRIVKREQALAPGDNGMVVNARLCRLVLDNYKTHKTYGRYTEDMPAVVEAVIRESLRKFPRSYLIQRSKSERPVSNKDYSDLLVDTFRKYLGKHINVDRLRRMWVTQRVDYNAMTIAETNEIARRMLHSPREQRRYKRV